MFRLRESYSERKPLSPREAQVLALIHQAKVNKEIAEQLNLTEGTVKQYVAHIFLKTGATTRVGLALRVERGEFNPLPAVPANS